MEDRGKDGWRIEGRMEEQKGRSKYNKIQYNIIQTRILL